ncbi:cyclase [Microbacterium barkeri]|uniref:Cyclase n=1 Tax=Microbacterium barkeri TaxID=33917 RepID=A0A9W6H6K4_9MICO|nr:SRPBCC family protein [Microbacterium barkeri]MDI6945033.1 SRPBCC family protein [Microbacterium barkeri]MDR6875030.1 putative membrane protein [Microbacterium barkeri]GLJ63059.1 cyclase [Microbacterium barkeri]
MATSLSAEIDVEAPLEEVYNQWTQIETFPEYLGAVRSVRQIDEVRSRWSVTIGGFTEDFYADIVDQVPDDHIVWQSTDGIFHVGRVDFAPIENGTRVTLRMVWEPEGMLESFGAAIGVDSAQAQRDLERFKEFMEARGTATGGWRGEVHRNRPGPADAI